MNAGTDLQQADRQKDQVPRAEEQTHTEAGLWGTAVPAPCALCFTPHACADPSMTVSSATPAPCSSTSPA